jgi:endoglucanase
MKSEALNGRRVPRYEGDVLGLLLVALAAPPGWDTPRHGANFMNEVETAERLHAAAAAGIRFIRLAPDKWRGAVRDFLVGDASDYRGIPASDLARLRAVLDAAHAEGISVVLTMLSLPGCRWKQNNGDTNDFRLYLEERYQEQAARFWRDLAAALRGHPALAGYNLLNEPRPERDARARRVDLRALYERLVRAVRAVDPTTPIVLDASDDASPAALARLTPLADPNVIYAFHFYEPWAYIDHRTKGRWRYPGTIDGEPWDRARISAAVQPVVAWQKRHGIPSSRVWLAELGVPRTKPGAADWLRDVLAVARMNGWHWSFYSFREDTWDQMDYELGTRPLGAAYWEAKERGETPVLVRGDNPVWRVIAEALR